MKNLIISVLLSSSISFAVSASTKETENVKFVGDVEYASFCQAVINDDLTLFKRAISKFVNDSGYSEEFVLKRVSTDDGISCGGQSLIEFSEQRNAQSVSSYIASKRA